MNLMAESLTPLFTVGDATKSRMRDLVWERMSHCWRCVRLVHLCETEGVLCEVQGGLAYRERNSSG